MLSCACRPPKIEPQERCTISVKFNYGTDEEIDKFFKELGKYSAFPDTRKEFLNDVLSVFGKTRCHSYDLMTGKRVGAAEDHPMLYGNGTTGFFAEDWAQEITPWAKESRRYYEDTCRKK